ncbi:undecaprenyl-diphosphate phosphatase [Caminibacter pacificus]|uniref:Undecaprenyl-diphosphatase n=1 Tax=Caminibacter pacificus TaxID=1424653 RepID=A0AAJ4UYK0_9BACT|nr:undecaprenyl-diphosphate phosphatase [Caminibacter pacificus]NPA87193.1 undecaprenyl-diphosphate phosphatase [Campylobacterota bacterium]QCI28379.1 undecaprenyl-diphosphate phosphatase [Caminibacter pacificus]ROR40898.1 undecaprenyl-diphosphatase [Caminibacter pacificus]
MTLIDSLILGIVEGITEFLPISSTAHMIVVSTLLGLKQTIQNVAFEVIIQLGATLAIVLIYLNKINFKEIDLWKKVILAFFPLAIVGFLLRHQIKELFTITTVAWMFIIGGIVFFVVEYFYKEEKAKVTKVEDVNYRQALIVGFFQVFALIPGTSRSGSTIVGGMLSGLSRKTAADFSFLLAIPTMFAASGYELLKNIHSFKDQNGLVLAVGFVVSFISAYVAVKLFLKFVEKYTLIPFGVYRILFGAALLWMIHIGMISG